MNTSFKQNALIAACVLVFACLCACMVPALAHAKDYSMPQVDIEAAVQPDGSLHVQETRHFSFDGSFTCVWWELNLDDFMVNNVKEGRSADSLQSVPEENFDTYWRSAGGPGNTSYSVDSAYGDVYVFFHAEDEDWVVQLDYTVPGAVEIYDDVAELYWKYIGPGWAVSSRNVTCTITLPALAGETTPIPGDTVRAWGHGPLDGNVTIAPDGESVTYSVGRVPSGDFAEARIAFPRDWVGAASFAQQAKHEGEMGLPAILSEEESWAAQANTQRMVSRAFSGVLAVLSVGLVVFFYIMWRRHGREYTPEFSGDYWRDVPAPGVHPAVIGRLWRFGAASNDDLTATILHLAHLGVVTIAKGTYPDKHGRPVEDYYLTLNPNVLAMQAIDPIDRKTVEFLFGKIAKNTNSLWLGSIAEYGKKHPEGFNNSMKAWRETVEAAVNQLGYFEKEGDNWRVIAWIVGIVMIIAAGSWWMITDNFLPLLVLLPSAVIICVIGAFMPRRSKRAVEDYARCKALKAWLQEFSALDERPPMDVKVWGEFMVYAFLFGVADEVMRQLRDTIPQLFATDDAYARDNSWYVPWYGMYGSRGTYRNGGSSFSDAFNTTWSNTVSTVSAALSSDSSGSGGGGGFSGGGGGGFGGGGGGAR